jgi:hypothetical protein
MKTLFLKHKIISFFLIISLAVSFNGCGSDSDERLTFLENHADSEWKFSDDNIGVTLYVKINNSQTSPFEFWISILDELCYIHESIDDDGNVEILENTENKLVVKIIDNPDEYSIITLTVSGTILTVMSENFEDGVLEDTDLFILSKTSDNLEDLEICVI